MRPVGNKWNRPCAKCLQVLPRSEFSPRRKGRSASWCKACMNAYIRDYRAKHPEILRAAWRAQRAQLLADPSKRSAYNARSRDYLRRLRLAAYAALGGKCACCGESERAFLEIDHVLGNGQQHRNTAGFSQDSLYRDVVRGRIGDLRLLCSNCNRGRARNGHCPHEDQRQHDARWIG